MKTIEDLRAAEATAFAVARGCAEAHKRAVEVVTAYTFPGDPAAHRQMTEARRDMIVIAEAAYALVVRSALEHDALATALAIAEHAEPASHAAE